MPISYERPTKVTRQTAHAFLRCNRTARRHGKTTAVWRIAHHEIRAAGTLRALQQRPAKTLLQRATPVQFALVFTCPRRAAAMSELSDLSQIAPTLKAEILAEALTQ